MVGRSAVELCHRAGMVGKTVGQFSPPSTADLVIRGIFSKGEKPYWARVVHQVADMRPINGERHPGTPLYDAGTK